MKKILILTAVLSLLTSSPTSAQLTATVHPGYSFSDGERPTTETLNQLGQPTIDISGTVSGTVGLAAGSVTGTHLANNVPDSVTLDYNGSSPRQLEIKAASVTTREMSETVLKSVPQFAAGTWSGTAYAVTLSPAVTAYTAGMVVRFTTDVVPTGLVKVNVNGLGDKLLISKGVASTGLLISDVQAGQLIEAVYDGTNFQLESPRGYAAEPVVATGRNILVKNDVGSPNSILNVSFDELVLKTATWGRSVTAGSGGTLLANIATSGAGGLDTGVEANSTWYYVWAIYNPTTGTVRALLSLQNTPQTPGPTMPSGYTYLALIGAIYNDSGGNFIKVRQQDRMAWVNETAVFNNQAGSVTYTSQSLSPLVPPIAVRAWGAMGLSQSQNKGMAVAANANGLGACVTSASAAGAGATDSFFVAGRWDVPLETSQTVFWLSQDTASSYRLTVSGYQF